MPIWPLEKYFDSIYLIKFFLQIKQTSTKNISHHNLTKSKYKDRHDFSIKVYHSLTSISIDWNNT